jgi:hypothetical protein
MTKITAQPALNTLEEYLQAFAAQTLNKDRGPWIMVDPDDKDRPKDVTRGKVMFYHGEISPSDDMDWCWGGSGDYAIAAYYPLEVRSHVEEEDDENPFLYWHGKSGMPSKVDDHDLVEVIFRDGDRSIDPAEQFKWEHGSEAEGWEIVAYRIIADSPLMAGVWHHWVGNEDNSIPKDLQPHTRVCLSLRDGTETSYQNASSWDWAVDHDNPSRGDIIAYKIED